MCQTIVLWVVLRREIKCSAYSISLSPVAHQRQNEAMKLLHKTSQHFISRRLEYSGQPSPVCRVSGASAGQQDENSCTARRFWNEKREMKWRTWNRTLLFHRVPLTYICPSILADVEYDMQLRDYRKVGEKTTRTNPACQPNQTITTQPFPQPTGLFEEKR